MTHFLASLVLLSLLFPVSVAQARVLNDIHSALNATKVDRVYRPKTVEEIRTLILKAKKEGKAVSISGGQHSMGGQQYGTDTLHLNLSKFNRVVSLDESNGIVEVQSGIQWPALIDWLVKKQEGKLKRWGIRQKQTGADNLSIGGALSSNIHGRGLELKPMVGDVESFTLVDARGRLLNVSREENPQLFSLAVGGYGLFGVIANVKIRLMRVEKLERVVELLDVKNFIPLVHQRIREGHLYGDFQFSTNENSPEFLQKGVYSLYKPVSPGTPMPLARKELDAKDWERFYLLAHRDKAKVFDMYSKFYLSTNGQYYWSDTNQLSVYLDHYHRALDKAMNAPVQGSEMISEVYVPRSELPGFLKTLRSDFRKNNTNLIYGTIRLIRRDNESFLAWAKKDYACIVVNLHVDHSPEGLEKAKKEFRGLIDRALERGGSYFLTYHRWARKDQALKAYPQFPEFLRLKKEYDPEERFQSEWYRHYKGMFQNAL